MFENLHLHTNFWICLAKSNLLKQSVIMLIQLYMSACRLYIIHTDSIGEKTPCAFKLKESSGEGWEQVPWRKDNVQIKSLLINRKDETALTKSLKWISFPFLRKWYIFLYFMRLLPFTLLGLLLPAGYEDCLVARKEG